MSEAPLGAAVARIRVAIPSLGALVALGLVSGCSSPRAATTPASSSAPTHTVRLIGIEGLPADSLGVLPFMAGLRGAFADARLPAERVGASGKVMSAGSVPNRFRLVEDKTDGAYQLQIVIEWAAAKSANAPAGADSSSNEATVLVAALSPEAAAAGARPIPVREQLRLRFPGEAQSRFYGMMGRTVALIGLEALHRQSGDLASNLRLRLDRADRARPIKR